MVGAAALEFIVVCHAGSEHSAGKIGRQEGYGKRSSAVGRPMVKIASPLHSDILLATIYALAGLLIYSM